MFVCLCVCVWWGGGMLRVCSHMRHGKPNGVFGNISYTMPSPNIESNKVTYEEKHTKNTFNMEHFCSYFLFKISGVVFCLCGLNNFHIEFLYQNIE